MTEEALKEVLKKHSEWLKTRVSDKVIGETVTAKDFDYDRWNECAPGIHFFITRQEAEEY